MPDELMEMRPRPTAPENYDFGPDLSGSGPVVRFLGGICALFGLGMFVVPLLVYLAPLIPFVVIFLIGRLIDKAIAKCRPRRRYQDQRRQPHRRQTVQRYYYPPGGFKRLPMPPLDSTRR